ncbi:MAG TPA: protein-glutamate O-methyltransferase CheR [Rhizomicrobium sp.]|jgi:chemotaxis protein methyltransferase CheR
MNDEDFLFLARLARRMGGLALNKGKGAKLEERLQPVAQRFGLRDGAALMAQLKLGHEALAGAVLEALTVSETSFFRDAAMFARLRDEILPTLVAARSGERRLRIWSAGCASGQEVWSLAILLDALPLQGWTVDLIGTDLSGASIRRAEQGLYSQFEVMRGLSEQDVARYFQAQEQGFLVSERLKHMVRFRVFNLLDSFGWLDDLDLVLCRNVLMHFDRSQRLSVLERLAEVLAPDGVLVLGETENVQLLTSLYQAMPNQKMSGAPGFFMRARAQVTRLATAI